jgi:hypothetical protein
MWVDNGKDSPLLNPNQWNADKTVISQNSLNNYKKATTLKQDDKFDLKFNLAL